MKKMLKGFSLAELLIAMAIIAIIATLGVSISKQGIENAYNAYWYTGYRGLYDSLSEITYEGKSIINVTNAPLPIVSLNQNFISDMADLLNIQRANRQMPARIQDSASMTAPNGIMYTIQPSPDRLRDADGNFHNIVYIHMQVPQAKRNPINTTHFIYAPTLNSGMLIPYTPDNNSMDLQNRKDLLPFYVDDGISGKVIVSLNGTRSFQRRSFYSYREAYCRRYGSNLDTRSILAALGDTTRIDCTGFNKDLDGILKPENPKKVF